MGMKMSLENYYENNDADGGLYRQAVTERNQLRKRVEKLEGFIEYIATWNSTVKRMWKTFQEKDNETL